MNKQQIEKLKELDPQGTNGTIQAVLMSKEINTIQFEKALLFILNAEIGHKNKLAEENSKLIITCKEAGVNLNRILFS